MMGNPSKTIGYFAMVALLALLFGGFISLYHCFFTSFSSQLLLSRNERIYHQQSIMTYRDVLGTALSKASMGNNKTLIIAVVNKAYVEQDVKGDPTTMFDLFLNSFWLGEGTRSLVDNILIVAVDQTAYDRCQFLKLNCYKLETDGVDFGGEKLYMSQDFINMMWTRTFFLLEILKRGYNFIFTVSLFR
ncbi:putative nucleotide-diphospho-sugar transferase [Medicago truncatula]|uniref:Putative nucleotide-diphospho-sugar transferase n=1 Tax=Medicago truncatula TaxID=3880 RepID=A0A396GEH2_MEDTR|nr:putative nucleotide-diphospho-sugar transferase [Medicago truncatula]